MADMICHMEVLCQPVETGMQPYAGPIQFVICIFGLAFTCVFVFAAVRIISTKFPDWYDKLMKR